MKTTLIIVTFWMLATQQVFAQDFVYEGPARSEVRSFWTNAMGIQRSGKIAEGVAMMEAKLQATKQKDPAYKTTDMENELKKWKDKLAAESAKPAAAEDSPAEAGIVAPKRMVSITDLTLNPADPGYTGAAKMYVANFYKQSEDAMKLIKATSFNTAQNKVEQMEKSLTQIKAKDASYNTAAMDAQLQNFKDALATEQYKAATGHAANRNAEQNNLKADDLLRQLFESTHIGFSTGDEPVMPLRIQEYKDKTQAYLNLGAKGTANYLDFTKKLADKHIMETNTEITVIDNLVAKGSGTNWATIAYYTIQYHLAYWDAAKKVFTAETAFTEEYNKVAAFAAKIGTIENMMAKGKATEQVEINNRKMPAPVVKDAAMEKLVMDQYNLQYGNSHGCKSLKAVLTQADWTIKRNEITGVILSRYRTAKLAYKGGDGKCYLLPQYVIISQQNTGGSSYGASKVEFNGTGFTGDEILCDNVK